MKKTTEAIVCDLCQREFKNRRFTTVLFNSDSEWHPESRAYKPVSHEYHFCGRFCLWNFFGKTFDPVALGDHPLGIRGLSFDMEENGAVKRFDVDDQGAISEQPQETTP